MPKIIPVFFCLGNQISTLVSGVLFSFYRLSSNFTIHHNYPYLTVFDS